MFRDECCTELCFAWVKEEDELLENDVSKEELEGYQELGSVAGAVYISLPLVFDGPLFMTFETRRWRGQDEKSEQGSLTQYTISTS